MQFVCMNGLKMIDQNNNIARVGGAVGGISITPSGAVVTGSPLQHTLEECMIDVVHAEKACLFVLGDLIIAAEDIHGERSARWAEITGKSIQSIYNVVSTCRRVPIEQRILDNGVSFDHHHEVAALPSDEQLRWLEIARDEKLASRTLRASIKLGRIATTRDMAQRIRPDDDKGQDNIHPHVNRLVVFLGKQDREGAFDSLDVDDLYEVHKDLMPVVARYMDVVKRIHAAEEGVAVGMPVSCAVNDDLSEVGLNSIA